MSLSSKKILRLEALQKLTHLSMERRQEAALAAFSFMTTELLKHNTPVLSFASKPLEINLWPLNHYLLKENKLFLPKQEGESLNIYHVQSLEELIPSNFSVHEPDSNVCKKIHKEEVLIILVPALCFDNFHHRVGYGKGIFDRFLSSFPHAKKWGIGFKEQKIEKIPSESHDIKLDEIFLF